jgi:hypothetical protein
MNWRLSRFILGKKPVSAWVQILPGHYGIPWLLPSGSILIPGESDWIATEYIKDYRWNSSPGSWELIRGTLARRRKSDPSGYLKKKVAELIKCWDSSD